MRRKRRYRLIETPINNILTEAAKGLVRWAQNQITRPEFADNEMLKTFEDELQTIKFVFSCIKPVFVNHGDRFIRPTFYIDLDDIDRERELLERSLIEYIGDWLESNASKMYHIYKSRLDVEILGSYSYDDSDNENKNFAVDFDEEGGLDTKTNSTIKSKSRSISGREKLKSWTNTQHNRIFKQLINEITETITFINWSDIWEGDY